MTTNEKIAKGLGWLPPNERIARFAGLVKLDEPVPITLSWAPGHYALVPTAHWWKDANGMHWVTPPEYNTDITLWHDGLLAKIADAGLWDMFCYEVSKNPPTHAGVLWAVTAGLTATPAQLSAALVEVIDDD